VLFGFLLATELLDLEELEPAFVAEEICAELDHLTVDQVVRWDIPCDQLHISRLQVSYHLQVYIDALRELMKVQL